LYLCGLYNSQNEQWLFPPNNANRSVFLMETVSCGVET
jgi:hypothetical protein